MIKVLALSSGLALLIGGAATAQTAGSVAPAEQVAKPEKPKKICRKEVDVGSIMPTRTCHTKDEWSEIDQRNGNAVRQLNDPNGRYGGFRNGRDG